MTTSNQSCVLSSLPGRVRLHVRQWSAAECQAMELQLARVPGIRSVQAHALTGNVLIHYDPAWTNECAILDLVRRVDQGISLPSKGATPSVCIIPWRGHVAGWPGSVPGAPWGPDPVPRLVARGIPATPPEHRLLDSLVTGVSIMLSLLLADSLCGLILAALDAWRLITEATAAHGVRATPHGALPTARALAQAPSTCSCACHHTAY